MQSSQASGEPADSTRGPRIATTCPEPAVHGASDTSNDTTVRDNSHHEPRSRNVQFSSPVASDCAVDGWGQDCDAEFIGENAPSTPTKAHQRHRKVPSLSLRQSPASEDDEIPFYSLNGTGGSSMASMVHNGDFAGLSPPARLRSSGEIPAIAAVRGQGLEIPDLSHRCPGSPSDITDGGAELYNNRKQEQDRRPPDDFADDAKEDDEQEDSLAERLHDAAMITVDPNTGSESNMRFLPKGQIDRLLDEPSVKRELNSCGQITCRLNPNEIARYAKKICSLTPVPPDSHDSGNKPRTKSFQKIFGILAYIDKTESIVDFVEEDISDLDLPLHGRPTRPGGRIRQLCRNRYDNEPVKSVSKWKPINIKDFVETQWSFLSPYFTRGGRKNPHHFILRRADILPFPFEGNSELHRGGQSNVCRVYIHPDHLDSEFLNSTAGKTYFAVRKLRSASKDEFKKEVSILKKFSGDTSPHLISLLATYEHSDEYFLIFRWAETDLYGFWKALRQPELRKVVPWMIAQCAGLTEGLTRIHQYQDTMEKSNNFEYGRHGDIKPQNILLYRDPRKPDEIGTLKLSDFGLTRFHTMQSKSRDRRSDIGNSLIYRPPECDVPRSRIRRSYDIWSLGCVFLEFNTWALDGFRCYEEFVTNRLSPDPEMMDVKVPTFFEFDEENQPRVKSVVVKHFDFLQEIVTKKDSAIHVLGDWLRLIQSQMLIVESQPPDPTERITASQLAIHLKKYRGEVEKSSLFDAPTSITGS